MIGAETTIVGVQWLTQILNADPVLSTIPGGIWHKRRQSGTAYPYIVFEDAGSKPILGVGATTVAGDCRFIVKVVGEALDGQDFGYLVPWLKQLNTVLEAASGPVAPSPFDNPDDMAECQGAFCETPLLYDEPAGTRRVIWHVGGIWSLFLG